MCSAVTRGYFERPNIVGFLERNSPPPDMGAHVTMEHVRNRLSCVRTPKSLNADAKCTVETIYGLVPLSRRIEESDAQVRDSPP